MLMPVSQMVVLWGSMFCEHHTSVAFIIGYVDCEGLTSLVNMLHKLKQELL